MKTMLRSWVAGLTLGLLIVSGSLVMGHGFPVPTTVCVDWMNGCRSGGANCRCPSCGEPGLCTEDLGQYGSGGACCCLFFDQTAGCLD